MAIKGLAVHVVTTQRKVGDKVYKTHLLRHSYREGDQVKTSTVANLSSLPDSLIELIKLGLKGEAIGPANGQMELLEARPHGHVAAVLGMLRKLELDRIFATRSSREKDLAVALVAGRVLHPGSKLSLSRLCAPDSRVSTLAQVLGVEGADENELYGAMDWLVERQAKIEAALAARHLTDGCLVLYDVSSSYFEGHHCPLAQHGYSRDHRPDRLQITYGLLCNSEGCPVAVEVFEGNTGDPSTLPRQIQKLKERFHLNRVVLVGDRGMITETRIEKDLIPAQLEWVTALRGPAIERMCAERVIQPSLFDERGIAEITHPDFPEERLIACFNPFTREKRERQRGELLEATEEELRKVHRACLRKQKPLHGKGVIGIEVGKALASRRMAKYFKVEIQEDGFTFQRCHALIALEAAADGIYVIRTKVPVAQLSAHDARATYMRLSKVERAFRSLKGVDLQIRPIHHHLADRVKAHVFLCMLAYYLEWHLRQAWEPLLFQGEGSKVANGKRATGRTEEGLPVMGYRDLLKEMAAYSRNLMRFIQAPTATAVMHPTPSPLQQRAFDLLGVTPAL
jgi:hypothetical protein